MANALSYKIPSTQRESQKYLLATQSQQAGTSQQSLSILDQGFLENPFEEMEFTRSEDTSRTSDPETTFEKVLI